MSGDVKKRRGKKFKTILSLPHVEEKKGSLPNPDFSILLYLFISAFTLATVVVFQTTPLLLIAGMAILLLMINLVYGIYLVGSHRRLVANKRSIINFSLLLLTPLVVAKVAVLFGWPIWVVPIGFFALVFSLGYSPTLGLINSVWIAFAVGLISSPFGVIRLDVTLPLLAGGMFTIYTFNKIKTSTGLRRLGFAIGLAQVITYYGALFLTRPHVFELGLAQREELLMYMPLWAFANGVVTGWIISESLPLLEKIFNIVTDVNLQKLAEQNHPLLRRLNLLAPGTYHHSVMVGTIAEAAAEAIGANALLTRVGGYFHDIGKMIKPDYYIENIAPHQQNKHDNLSPAMSTLIITAHPRDGAEMGREYGLPQRIIDFMLEHHGTSLVIYFYQKAMKLAEETGEEISEESFRYPGPRPQSKETAILCLADPIEAASRTLVDPTPASIQRLVEAIIDDRIQDGQLNECDLHLHEIAIIRKTFIRMLLSIFHSRISYGEKDEEGDGDKEKKEKKGTKYDSTKILKSGKPGGNGKNKGKDKEKSGRTDSPSKKKKKPTDKYDPRTVKARLQQGYEGDDSDRNDDKDPDGDNRENKGKPTGDKKNQNREKGEKSEKPDKGDEKKKGSKDDGEKSPPDDSSPSSDKSKVKSV